MSPIPGTTFSPRGRPVKDRLAGTLCDRTGREAWSIRQPSFLGSPGRDRTGRIEGPPDEWCIVNLLTHCSVFLEVCPVLGSSLCRRRRRRRRLPESSERDCSAEGRRRRRTRRADVETLGGQMCYVVTAWLCG